MTCQQCGTENPTGNRFCMRCGAELTPAGAGVEPGTAASEAYAGASPLATEAQSANEAGPQYARPVGAGYAAPDDQPPGSQSGGYSNPYGGPANPYMAQQGFAHQGQPGFVWSPDQLVGFGPRLGAYLIDWVILIVIGAILNAIHLGGLGFFVGMAYFGYFWGTTGQSLGMQALGMKVVRTDGQPVSVVLAIVRYICYIISAIPLFLGFLWIIWDSKKQGFHDKIVGTVVVRA